MKTTFGFSCAWAKDANSMSVIEKKPRQPNFLFMDCLFFVVAVSCGCWTDIASASCIVYSARALRGHKFCKFFKRTGPLFCDESTMSGMARYYITPYRLKQISFLCDPERQTDRFVLLGITLLFSESKQGRAWASGWRRALGSADRA